MNSDLRRVLIEATRRVSDDWTLAQEGIETRCAVNSICTLAPITLDRGPTKIVLRSWHSLASRGGKHPARPRRAPLRSRVCRRRNRSARLRHASQFLVRRLS